MKKNNQDIDKLTRQLLKKSMQKPSKINFDDVLMEKILHSPTPPRLTSNGSTTKKAWIFLVIAIGCFLITALVIGEFLGNYFTEVDALFQLTANYAFFGGLALFIPLVLYHFDALIQTMIMKKQERISLA